MKRAPLPLAALLLLTSVNLLNYADRYLLGGAQELLKRDPSLTGGLRVAEGLLADASLGTLAAIFFLAYVLTAPLFGYLGDRLKRTQLTAGSVALLSLATLGTGLAPTYGSLLLARALVGLASASLTASAAALLADLFPVATRGRAVGLFYAAMPLGAALGFLLGGAAGSAFGWRAAFIGAATPGLFLSLACLFMNEPARGASEVPSDRLAAQRPLSPLETLRALVQNRAWMLATAGMTLMTFAAGGIGQWMPSFLVRSSGLDEGRAGLFFGAVTATAGLLGTIAGTWLGEVAQRRTRAGYFLVTGLGLALAAPVVAAMTRLTSAGAILAMAFAGLFLVMLNTGPLNTALVNAAPAGIRASALSVNLVVIHLLGDAFSPALIGWISDETGDLGLAIAANALPLLLGGALLLVGPSLYLKPETPAARGAEVLKPGP